MDLFDQIIMHPEQNTSLSVKKQHKVPVSSAQAAFNRALKKVEKLRKDTDGLRVLLDSALARHTLHVAPLEAEATRLRGQLLDLLYPFHENAKALPKKDRWVLGGILRGLLDEVIGSDEEALERHKAMFKAINGEHYDDVVEEDMVATKRSIQAMFAEHGIDIDLSDVDMRDPEASARKLQELQARVQAEKERRDQQAAGRKKTKRQLDKEAREAEMEKARDRSFAVIYKQLARSFHPDLEPDETLKAQKEGLMKQLTAAYEARDLHTLLKLEAEWLSSNSANIQALTDEKLSLYTAVLKEQVSELEVEYHRIYAHPRFEPLMPYGMEAPKGLTREIDQRARELRMLSGTMHASIEKLKGEDALQEVLACTRMVAFRR